MPASTFEIISSQWEDEDEIFKNIVIAARNAEIYISYFRELELRVEPSSERSLVFVIQSQKDVDWYYNRYPTAVDEPEERVPYFVFNKSISKEKLYSIAMANNYLDSELIWKFSKEYLKANPTHIISLNREVFIDSKRMAKIVESNEYSEGWCFNLDKLSS